jgi:hypothetical protein
MSALRLAKSAPVAKPASRVARVVRPSVVMRTMPVSCCPGLHHTRTAIRAPLLCGARACQSAAIATRCFA